MNTQCPQCRSVFRVGQAQLDAANGRVRCSRCRRVFDARARLQTELPLDGAATLSSRQRTSGPTARLNLQGRHEGPVSGVLLSDVSPAREEPAGASPRGYRTIGAWAAVNTVLLVALCAQLIFIQRAAFAQDPTLRPVVERMCQLADCVVPARRDLEAIELIRRNVYAHPNVDDALIIDVEFVNNAVFAQPYPTLTIGLGDIRGKPLIRRNFAPPTYRPRLDPNARMAPGAPVQVSLEVRDPGERARTFQIDFSYGLLTRPAVTAPWRLWGAMRRYEARPRASPFWAAIAHARLSPTLGCAAPDGPSASAATRAILTHLSGERGCGTAASALAGSLVGARSPFGLTPSRVPAQKAKTR